VVLAGRYELGELLGAGGMGRVLAAHDRVLDREVAVKLLGPTPDERARERFVREARAAARLHHPNVVQVHDAGDADGQPYLVMELVRGRTAADLLDDEGPVALEVATAITLGVLDPLAAAHAQGLVHRDVKPGNVLLPDDGGVKLADFGIAKALDEPSSGLTTSGTVVGTASYLAPELVEGAAASPASDVYAVGCLLYALLTGAPPYTGEHALAVAYAHRHAPVPDVRDRRPDVPDDLRAVLERALAKDPAARYPDASAMRAALLDGPAAVPTAATPTPLATPPATAATTAVLAPDVPERRGSGPRRTAPLVAVLAAAALVVAGLWWAAGRTDDATPTVPGEAPAQDGAPADPDPAPAEPEPGDPTEPTPQDEDPAVEDTVEDLIGELSSTPSGTYGEKHDDLLGDLVDLTRELPEDRPAEAAAVREDVEDWVADGELDPEVGRRAIAVLDREADG
jgi:hypothetical protein